MPFFEVNNAVTLNNSTGNRYRKRVLVTGLTNDAGGTERIIFNYTSRMQSFFEFDYVCREYPHRYETLFTGGNRCHVVPYRSESPIEHFRAVNEIFKSYADEYLAIWAHMSTLTNITYLKHAARKNIPVRILHMHSKAELGPYYKRFLGRIHKTKALKLATNLWACSRESADYFFGEGNGVVVPNAIEQKAYLFSKDKRKRIRSKYCFGNEIVVGTVGRLSEEKNQGYLIPVLKELIQRGHDAKVLIVGEGPLENSILEEASKQKLKSRVILAGAQSDIQAYLSSFDVFVLPSHYEALPLSLIEAQCNGLPCITTTNVSKEVDISNGIIHIPLSNVTEWAECIASLRRSDCAISGEKLLRYSIDEQAQNICTFLQAAYEDLHDDLR